MQRISEEIKEAVYLDYYNNYLTLHKMTVDYQEFDYFNLLDLDFNEAHEKLSKIIDEGREIHKAKS